MIGKLRNIITLLFLLPVFFALSGLSVISHDCSLCGHNDVDLFSTDNCCNESHDIMACCHEEKGINEELHKCRHTVYMFSSPTIISFSDIFLNTEAPLVLTLNTVYKDPGITGTVNVEKFYPPPVYISNCILRT